MTELDLEAIKARHAATTQLEWEAGDVWVYTSPVYDDSNTLSDVLGGKFADNDRAQAEHDRGFRNAIFIAEAHRDVPALVAEVERLQAALVTIRSSIIAGMRGDDQDAPNGMIAASYAEQIVREDFEEFGIPFSESSVAQGGASK